MKNTNQKISIIIKTLNSGETLVNTLESVSQFGEIIAIDEHSTDDTIDILNEYKVKIIYSDKFNLTPTLKQAEEESKGDWIFLLNDDEIIPKSLLNKIAEYIETPKKNKFSLLFDIKTFYLNKEIKSAGRKNILKFFKKGFCEFKNDNTFEVELKKGKTYKIKHDFILKYVQNDISKHLNVFINRNKNILKNSNKISSSVILKPVFTFFYFYILKFGFLDGIRGYIFAKMKFFEKLILEIMILEKNFKEKK